MRDRHRFRQTFGALTLVLGLGALVAAPAALAQTGPPATTTPPPPSSTPPPGNPPPPTVSDAEDWAGSKLTTPFSGSTATVTQESFAISGVFRKLAANDAERIVSVAVRFARPGDEQADPTDECVPDDPATFVRGGGYDSGTATYPFTVASDVSTWPCNGRFVVIAEGQSNQEAGPFTLEGSLTVLAPPLPIRVIDAVGDEASKTVEVSFEPLADADLAVDAEGYRLERAGPRQPDGAFGPYQRVGRDIDVDDAPVFDDTLEATGAYRYRVRSLRDGVDAFVPSPIDGTGVAEVQVGPDPVATTTTSPSPAVPRLGGSGGVTPRTSSTGRPGSSGPPTTLDTGFDQELDYGDRAFEEPGELASEGQSIIRTPGEGVGLVAPVAGALVLLGWAGHITYLNRLAKQF